MSYEDKTICHSQGAFTKEEYVTIYAPVECEFVETSFVLKPHFTSEEIIEALRDAADELEQKVIDLEEGKDFDFDEDFSGAWQRGE